MWLPIFIMALSTSVWAQEKDVIEPTQNHMFGIIDIRPNSSTTKTGGSGNIGKDVCNCVPYYLCSNNTNKDDGVGIIDIRGEESPCENYFDVCCEDVDSLEVAGTNVAPLTQMPVGCGNRMPEGIGFKITGVGNEEAGFGEFPWMVAILSEEALEGSTNKYKVYQCGGSLIHPKVVLTAAHCVTGKNDGKKFKIRAGEWDTQTDKEIYPHQDRDVESIVTHDNYRNITLFNDMALLFLKEPVELAENVQTVCLPAEKTVINEKECFASGWGKDVSGKEGKYAPILQKVELPMVDHAKCQDQLRKTRLGTNFELHDSFVCAGGIMGRNTCKGDGGSPLVCPIPGQKGRYQQVGIVSWSIGCGNNDIPAVYSSVALLRAWIDEQMQSKSLETTFYKY